MKFPNSWLKEWVEHGLTPQALGDRLSMAGLELDSLEPAAPAFEGIVVGRVTEIAPHPDADKLRVCQVDAGTGSPLQVVCGAANVHADMLAPFAQVGARLPGGMTIRKAKLRGVESSGMLCSASELGLAETSSGLMELPADLEVGQDLRQAMGLDDAVLEVDLTPNRADCLSLAGVAREVALLSGRPLNETEIEPVEPACEAELPVEIQAPEACPVYVGRVIRGVDPQAVTPLWMQERLRRCGIRSLGPFVDVTNYVMLELGQPMHAFDLAQIKEGIRVRMAQAGEEIVLLDGQTLKLNPDCLVIADAGGPLALAGVMGGQHSGVGAQTSDIFLESAFFTPEAIAGRARRFGLHTDSSHRFERGVDPALQAIAVERATALILQIAGGTPGPAIKQAYESKYDKKQTLTLRSSGIERVLGVVLDGKEVETILRGLGCEIEPAEGGWSVIPPSWRFDLSIEVDLIEELARVHGYEAIPAAVPIGGPQAIVGRPERILPLDILREQLVTLGYQEAITYSFVDQDIEALLAPDSDRFHLANPISSELSVMRSSLWSGLLRALQRNLNRQQARVRIFESGLRFVMQANELKQINTLSGLVSGARYPTQWGEAAADVDFYDLKADLEALFSRARLSARDYVPLTDNPALHPGQAAEIRIDGRCAGCLGALHPEIEAALDLAGPIYLFELDLDTFDVGQVPAFAPLSRYPAIRRDLAIVVDEKVSYAQLRDAIQAESIPELQDFYVFDVYRGEGVPNGRKSFAFSLILQDLSRTLSDEDVETIVSRLISRLGADVGAELRV
ncbi:MAG: phenylalanine--tRNA ligase subunit beta [Gammaproteobacteria bacterium]